MFDFHKAYRVMIREPHKDSFLGIAVGIRPFEKDYPYPFEKHGHGHGFEWIPNSPIWRIRRAFLDVLNATADRIEAKEKFAEFSGNNVIYVFEPLTADRLAEVKNDILDYDRIMNDQVTDEDVQEYFLGRWLRPNWSSEESDGESIGEMVAYPVGTIHSWGDGWDHQKMPSGEWKTVRKTPGAEAARLRGETGEEEPPESEEEDEAWPEEDVPAGGVWKDHAEGVPRSTQDLYMEDPLRPGEEDKMIPTPHNEERSKAIYDEVRRRCFKGKRPVSKHRKPVAILTMGAPASGKTSAVQNVVSDRHNFVHIDPDLIKTVIPEFQEAKRQRAKDGASITRWESGLIAANMRDEAISKRMNIVFDGVGGDPEYYSDMIRTMKDAGYEVQLVMTHTEDADEAVARSNRRGARTGRWVPEHVVRAGIQKVPKSFASVHHMADSFAVFDTDAATSPANPILAWASKEGDETVPDPEVKDRILSGRAGQPEHPRPPRPPRPPAPERAPEPAREAMGPDVSMDTTIKAFQQAFRLDHAYMETTPSRFSKNQGIILDGETRVPFPKRPAPKK